MKYGGMSVVVTLLLLGTTGCVVSTDTVSTGVATPLSVHESSEFSTPLLFGLTSAEREVLSDFREKCPTSTGVKLFFDPQRRVIVMDVDYLGAENITRCLQALDEKMIVPARRPTFGVSVEESDLPLLPQESNMASLSALREKFELHRGLGPGQIASVRIENGALRLGIRTIPYHCWQSVSIDDELHVSPFNALNPEVQDLIRQASRQGVAVSLDHEFIDPSWENCDSHGDSCDQPPVGC